LWVAAGIGAGMTVGLLAAQVPGKSADARAVLRSLDPSQGVVDRTLIARDEVNRAVAELEDKLLPDLANALGVSRPQLDAALARNLPGLVAARAELRAALARYDVRIRIRVAGAPELRRLRLLPLDAFAWGSVGFGVVVAVFSAFGLATNRSGRGLQAAAPVPPEGGG
jgi:hypothetical protein